MALDLSGAQAAVEALLLDTVFDELSRDAADKIADLIPRRNRPTAT